MPIRIILSMDGSLGLRSATTSFWHSDAVGGRPPQQEARLQLSGGVGSLPQVPQWNAGRRARPAGRAPHPPVRRFDYAPFGVPLPFIFLSRSSIRSFFRSFVLTLLRSIFCTFVLSWPSAIVRPPVFHGRGHLTKVAMAVTFLGMACS
jgi:hypothetical protein